MKFSEVFTLVSDESYQGNSLSFRIKASDNYLTFKSDIADVRYVNLYMKVHDKMPIEKMRKPTLKMLYDIELGDLPTMEKQAEYVDKFSVIYDRSVGSYEKAYIPLGNRIRHNLYVFNHSNTAVNIMSLIEIKDENLFREKVTNCDFDNYEDFVSVIDPALLRAKYLLYYVYFIHEDYSIAMNTTELSKRRLGLPTLEEQDSMIIKFEEFVRIKKETKKWRLWIKTIIDRNF